MFKIYSILIKKWYLNETPVYINYLERFIFLTSVKLSARNSLNKLESN